MESAEEREVRLRKRRERDRLRRAALCKEVREEKLLERETRLEKSRRKQERLNCMCENADIPYICVTV